MIKALSLAAALALLPLAASAQTPGPAEAAIDAAAETFEARMEAFGERAEAIAGDPGLTEAQRDLRIATLWAEYQPDVTAFTALVSEHASSLAAEALADIDIEAIVTDALSEVETSGAFAVARGMAANGAWASNDPEHMATYGLMADYVIGSTVDTLDEAQVEVDAAVREALAEADDEVRRAPDSPDRD